MKKLLVIIAPILLFAACKNSAENTTEQLKSTAATFAPIINGSWVMTDYITDLSKTKSPLVSSALLRDVVYMDIDTKDYTGDSLYVAVSFNNHEGGGFMAYFRNGQNTQSIKTALQDYQDTTHFYELGYDIAGADTTLVLYHYAGGQKLLDKRSFTKVRGEVSDEGERWGFQRAVNQVLIEGSYTATDEAGKQSTMQFTRDGMLQGVAGYSTYYIFTDFIAEEEGYKIDELFFDKNNKNQKSFIFAVNADTVRLYAAAENKERTKLEKGTLKYTLVKTK